MAYDQELAAKLRAKLASRAGLDVTEKKMFGGLAFMVDNKMCINVSKDRLMCRFDPRMQDKLARRAGFENIHMRGRLFHGYCYIQPIGYARDEDFDFWIDLSLAANRSAQPSPKNRKH